MKKLQIIKTALFLLIATLFSACSSKQNNVADQWNEQPLPYQETVQNQASPQQQKKAKSNNRKIVEHRIYEQETGMLMATMPIPATWQANKNRTEENSFTFSSKSGVKIFEYPYQMFTYTNDPYMQQLYQQSGQQLKPVQSPQQIIQNILVPYGQKEGLKLTKIYPINELAKVDEIYNSKLYKVMPMHTSFASAASEWEDGKGNKSLIIVRQQSSTAQGITSWGYYCNALDAPIKEFESAKNDLINSLLNVKHNPAQIAQYNQREAQKANQRNAQFQQRMSQNQANFNARQKAFRESNDAINNSMMSTWRNQNAASDRNQNQFLNYINDENTMTNPNTGQAYQVESGANQYWMNNNGEYIMSDDYNYNPNRDVNTYQQDWTQLENNY